MDAGLPPLQPTLSWTTPAGVAAQLARYLRSSGPPSSLEAVPDVSPRGRAAELLTWCATPSQWKLLRSLALDTREETEVRQNAIWALAQTGAGVSGADLERLLADRQLQEEEGRCFGTQDVLALARSPQATARARRYLLELTPKERTALVEQMRMAAPPRLTQWMYQHWVKVDRAALTAERGPDSPNVSLIRATCERVESRAALLGLWREARGGERSELLEILCDYETVDTFPGELTAAETDELTKALCLPLADLLANWGRSRLLSELHDLVATEQRVVEKRRRFGAARTPADEARYYRALRLLEVWKDPYLDDWIAEHALCARVHDDERNWLLEALWRRNRALSAATIVALLMAGDPTRDVLYILRLSANDPQEADRMMFREATQRGPAELQYHGLRGLERLGEAGDDWLQRLGQWTRHPEPRLRIRALGGLARRGDAVAWDVLLGWLESDSPIYERAEIASVLAEIDATACLTRFQRLLAQEEVSGGDRSRAWHAPAAEEAALALSRLATPAALTSLLQAYLTASTPRLVEALQQYLQARLQPDAPAVWPSRPGWQLEVRGWKEANAPR